MNFGPGGPEKIITRANLKASVQAYEEVSIWVAFGAAGVSLLEYQFAKLLTKCAAYRAALLNMSRATAAFADAMEVCASYVPLY